MTEINEKDLEQATGGVNGQLAACENFELKNSLPPFAAKICVNCKHYSKDSNNLDVRKGKCDLQIDEGE